MIANIHQNIILRGKNAKNIKNYKNYRVSKKIYSKKTLEKINGFKKAKKYVLNNYLLL
jgi:hypothetical protein